jgi:hypothetical protein
MSAWNPWKVTTIAMALVIATALATGLVVANWKSDRVEPTAQAGSQPATHTTAPRAAAPQKVVAAAPSQADTEACNLQARNAVGNRTVEVVKDAAIGGAVGAGTGAVGGAIAGGGKGAGTGAGIGGVVGIAAGTLYGLNATKSNDARYVEAYRACMRNRGFSG